MKIIFIIINIIFNINDRIGYHRKRKKKGTLRITLGSGTLDLRLYNVCTIKIHLDKKKISK